ncbi:hypothetical protein [Ruegeria arenilitoris]|uniref:hypothetical protein n=1 Tax=Ruegeria arenilitoris TaxID=1173585 RepID=UPI00147C1A92|nr:hypothetical protein [Ruegeria arenilitoris]
MIPKATQTPVVATLLVAAIIVLLTQTVPIGTLAERTSQIVLGVFVLVDISLILLKMQPDEAAKHFRVPFMVPILGVITSALLFGSGFL